jgi:hypothetical protein
MAAAQRRTDGVERVSKRAGDAVGAEVLRAVLDIASVRTQPLVICRGDAEAEHVHGLWLAAKLCRQLLRDE